MEKEGSITHSVLLSHSYNHCFGYGITGVDFLGNESHNTRRRARAVAMHEILILFAASEASIYPFKEVLFCWLFFWYSETRSHTVMSSHRLMLCFKALPCTRGRDIEIDQCLSKALTGVGTSAAWAQVQSALSLCKSARQLTQVKHLKGSLIDHHNCALLSFFVVVGGLNLHPILDNHNDW